ncbi:hypothetical protein ACLKA7_010557 [Drosophila subpalustris]
MRQAEAEVNTPQVIERDYERVTPEAIHSIQRVQKLRLLVLMNSSSSRTRTTNNFNAAADESGSKQKRKHKLKAEIAFNV